MSRDRKGAGFEGAGFEGAAFAAGVPSRSCAVS
jgi:hypothetical protein